MLRTCWLAVSLALWGAVATAQPSPGLPNVDVGLYGVKAVPFPATYWLGIECAPVPAPLRAQLDVPAKQGLLVANVAPDSPAAKAGIAQYDILLRAGDKPLKEPGDLIRAIEATKEGKLAIDLIRGGKPKTVEAVPAKRPEEARRSPVAAPGSDDWETIQKWLQGMGAGAEAGGDGQRPLPPFSVIRPGTIVPGDALASVPLPPNMSIVITKESNQPAKIVVRRGDEKWEAGEKELDKLPADVRPHVERMLGRGLMGVVGRLPTFDFVPKAEPSGDLPTFDFVPKAEPGDQRQPPRGSSQLERMEKRFEELNRRMDQLLKAVEELSEAPARHQAPEKPTEK